MFDIFSPVINALYSKEYLKGSSLSARDIEVLSASKNIELDDGRTQRIQQVYDNIGVEADVSKASGRSLATAATIMTRDERPNAQAAGNAILNIILESIYENDDKDQGYL